MHTAKLKQRFPDEYWQMEGFIKFGLRDESSRYHTAQGYRKWRLKSIIDKVKRGVTKNDLPF